jgi:glutathione S-transferase
VVVIGFLGGTPVNARVSEHANTVEGKITGYQAILSTQKYLAGDELTLADLFHLPYGVLAASQDSTFEDETRFPLVARCVSPHISRINLLIFSCS